MGRGFGEDEAALGSFGDVERRERLKRLFEEPTTGVSGATWSPQVDITDTGSAYRLTAEVPGMAREELDLAIHGDRLVLRGERVRSADGPGARYLQVERPEGIFQRTFRLPGEVDPQRASATLTHGVLRVVLPKKEPRKPARIPVEGAPSENA